MLRTIVVRTAVAGAAVLVPVVGAVAVGAVAVGAGAPVRQGSPAEPSAQACGGSAGVHCLSGHVTWNGTGLVIRYRG
ncbi:hypothetical protein [Kitasatospora sp. NBC_01300]|uniref:hypothetical protein n=1 Tax=Kitasatospora sp. NBC_01300 TaxID=2903574 RepID=UPI002F9170DA|nr:hypothetical protein OG556_37885 [Kitasatospora sp. NBC_01300]